MKKKINYYKKIVIKPWGKEYLVYQNKNVALWHLIIKKNEMTSFHCHPLKKTGFLLLEGQIEIDLGFYERKVLKAPDKLMIRPGLFHKTRAINGDAKIIEIENPVDKSDLVRFSDSYGRKSKPYEGINKMIKISKNEIRFQKNFKDKTSFKMNTLKMKIFEQKKVFFNKRLKNGIFTILEGGLYFKKKCILGPGDIVRKNIFEKLSKVFEPKKKIKYLLIF